MAFLRRLPPCAALSLRTPFLIFDSPSRFQTPTPDTPPSPSWVFAALGLLCGCGRTRNLPLLPYDVFPRVRPPRSSARLGSPFSRPSGMGHFFSGRPFVLGLFFFISSVVPVPLFFGAARRGSLPPGCARLAERMFFGCTPARLNMPLCPDLPPLSCRQL